MRGFLPQDAGSFLSLRFPFVLHPFSRPFLYSSNIFLCFFPAFYKLRRPVPSAAMNLRSLPAFPFCVLSLFLDIFTVMFFFFEGFSPPSIRVPTHPRPSNNLFFFFLTPSLAIFSSTSFFFFLRIFLFFFLVSLSLGFFFFFFFFLCVLLPAVFFSF